METGHPPLKITIKYINKLKTNKPGDPLGSKTAFEPNSLKNNIYVKIGDECFLSPGDESRF